MVYGISPIILVLISDVLLGINHLTMFCSMMLYTHTHVLLKITGCHAVAMWLTSYSLNHKSTMVKSGQWLLGTRVVNGY